MIGRGLKQKKSLAGKWKSISVIGDSSIEVYELNESGKLIKKFPKLKIRKNLFRGYLSSHQSSDSNEEDQLEKINCKEDMSFFESNTKDKEDMSYFEGNAKDKEDISSLSESNFQDNLLQFVAEEDYFENCYWPDEFEDDYFESNLSFPEDKIQSEPKNPSNLNMVSFM